MKRELDLEIQINELMGYLKKHDKSNRSKPYRLTPKEVRALLENEKLHNGRLVGCEAMVKYVASQLASARQNERKWGRMATKESHLSVEYAASMAHMQTAIDRQNKHANQQEEKLAAKDKALETAGRHMTQQEFRLAGSSKRAASLARQLKSCKTEISSLRNELRNNEIEKEYLVDEPEVWRNQIAKAKHDEAVEHEQEKTADLYTERIIELFSLRDARLIRHCLEYSVSDPAGLPAHNLMLIVANLTTYANLMPSEIEDAHMGERLVKQAQPIRN